MAVSYLRFLTFKGLEHKVPFAERCPPRHNSRVERLKAKVEPLPTQVMVEYLVRRVWTYCRTMACVIVSRALATWGGIQGAGFRFQVLGFPVFGFELRVSVFSFRESGFGSQVSDFEFWVSGFRSLVSGFRIQDSGFGMRDSRFGFRVSGFGLRSSARPWRQPWLSRQRRFRAPRALPRKGLLQKVDLFRWKQK